MLIANGYYKINKYGYFTINKPAIDKTCVFYPSPPPSIPTKSVYIDRFVTVLSASFDDIKDTRRTFFCATHKGFIKVLKRSGCKVLFKIPLVGKQNILGLYKYWSCPACITCQWKRDCFGSSGCVGSTVGVNRILGRKLVNEYLIVFRYYPVGDKKKGVGDIDGVGKKERRR